MKRTSGFQNLLCSVTVQHKITKIVSVKDSRIFTWNGNGLHTQGLEISALQYLLNISSSSSAVHSLTRVHTEVKLYTAYQPNIKLVKSSVNFTVNVHFQLPALASIVGESAHEGGSRSNKLSGAGGGRVFRDLDLLAEYMFSNSAYTADSLQCRKETKVRPLVKLVFTAPVRVFHGTYICEVVGSLG